MKVPLVVSYGGGVNSLAMLIGLRARGERPDAVVFSDTRGEKPETYDHMRDVLAPWLARNELPPLTVVCRADFGRSKTGDASLEAECLRLGNVPSRAFGFGTCADKWKIDPFKWWALEWAPAIRAREAGVDVVRCIGYDAGEERRVTAHGDKGFAKRFPLIEWGWGREECEAEIVRAGLAVPPKSACFFCPSSTKPEILGLAAKHPELMARALAMEAASNATGRWAIKGLGRRFAWGALVAAEQSQRALFPETPVESCTVCTESSCEVQP